LADGSGNLSGRFLGIGFLSFIIMRIGENFPVILRTNRIISIFVKQFFCMFHTILTLAYTIPGIYLFIRIWQLFIKKEDRVFYIFTFLLLFLVYPLSNILEDVAPDIAKVAEKVSDYLLPFYLYMFLLILLTDTLLLLNKLVRVIHIGVIRSTVFTYRYLAVIAFLSSGIVIAGIINFNSIRTTEYRITLPQKSSELKKLRIAFVSDFHLEQDVPERFVGNFIRKIKEINPDILLYGGDIVEGSGEGLSTFETMLREINTNYGSYGALGNHDRIRNFYDNFFSRSGIILLRDSLVVINNSFIIAGRIDNPNRRDEANALVADIPDLPVIMIDHRPTDFENISRTETDIVFSGHTHKGQLFPINLYMRRIYELTHGHLLKRNTHFIVSSGIRLWGPRVRTTGKSEIVVAEITLNP
jgi:uncharacterized protein